MPQSAYLAPREVEDINLNKIKDLLIYYKELMNKTGEQLSWSYGDSAYPYDLIEKPEDPWFYLKGKNEDYRMIIIGISDKRIQVVLPDQSTHGDKAKANELCKFLATNLKANLTLFNGRVIQHSQK
ncbi:DUF1885 family protein [Pseudalkalibacillus hwajinpoensis]|uniref:DUF1885 family protein n=1 Tax=Guptibacillus hwajinpoensis TaxID=208199 RepID=A0A4U1MM73_9BACL|nr:DUF1885 family protein [Pseudalkalibacillus hwajinpoensis]TKD71811.1 DUF1885 family protein [Pseudalkalibacillus hwajinpoensis]